MNKADLHRLNLLFEKVVDNVADAREQKQLESLYQLFINEDREGYNNSTPFNAEKQADLHHLNV